MPLSLNSFVRRPSAPRRGSCLVTLGIVFAVVLLLVGVAVFFTIRWAHKQVETYTATSPVPLPKSTLSAADYVGVAQRVEEFKTALNDGRATAPLVLNEQELNAYLERSDPKGVGSKVYLVLDGSHVKGQASFPLDSLNMSWVKGRYLNGNVTLDISLQDHHLWVTAQQIEVNGQSPSDNFMQGFKSQNLAENAGRDPKQAAQIAKFESIEIKDSKLTITAAAPATTAPAEPSAATPAATEPAK